MKKATKRLLRGLVAMLLITAIMVGALAAGYGEACPSCGYTGSAGIWWGGHVYEKYDKEYHKFWLVCNKCGAQDSEWQYGTHSGLSSDLTGYTSEGFYWHRAWYEECDLCGDTDVYIEERHSGITYTDYSDTQHKITVNCSQCGFTGTTYANHSGTKTYSTYNDSYHKVTQGACSACGRAARTYTEAHTLSSYGSWTRYSSSQHYRSATCSVCGGSVYQYGTHYDGNGDGCCDTCGASLSSVRVTLDANGGSCSKSRITVYYYGTYYSLPEPTWSGYTFLGWYTKSSGGSLVTESTAVASSSAHTLYAQWEEDVPSSYEITWDHNDGSGSKDTSEQTVGEALTLPSEPEREGYTFLGWYTAKTGGTEVDSSTVYNTEGTSTYYAHWEEIAVFSVSIPASLDLVMAEDGTVYTPTTAAIQNGSTAAVEVASVTVSTATGWTLVPALYNMADVHVDSKLVSFGLNDCWTTTTGTTQTLALAGDWTITKGSSLALDYDAKISATSVALDEQVLTLTFVVRWNE